MQTVIWNRLALTPHEQGPDTNLVVAMILVIEVDTKGITMLPTATRRKSPLLSSHPLDRDTTLQDLDLEVLFSLFLLFIFVLLYTSMHLGSFFFQSRLSHCYFEHVVQRFGSLYMFDYFIS